MRICHYLKAPTASEYPRNIIVFDTETTPVKRVDGFEEHTLVFGWAAYIRSPREGYWTPPLWHRFTTAAEFWDWVERQARPRIKLFLYCHNGNFDWQVLRMPVELGVRGWKCLNSILADPPNYFRWRRGNTSLAFLDTTNYWRVPLKEIGKHVSLAKLEMPPDWTESDKGDVYCRRDVEILLRALRQWIAWLRKNDLGSMSISLASQAFTAYKHRFMKHRILIDTNVRALALSRSAYMGGRCEAWMVGKELTHVTCLDVNSMYPYVMREFEYPTHIVGTWRRITPDDVRDVLTRHLVVARVTLRTDTPVYPLREGGKLLFPVGEFTTCLTTRELSYALEHGHVSSVEEIAVYTSAPIFRDFVEEMYELRLQYAAAGNDAGYYFVKIMMNSLYGKFGQQATHTEVIDYCDPRLLKREIVVDFKTGKRHSIRYIGGRITYEHRDGESGQSHPAIAAHVTGNARLHLWNLAERVGFQHVVYMDTDSLHVTGSVSPAILADCHATRLGALKREKTVERARYYGAKDYEHDGVVKTKGVRRSAIQVADGVYEQEQWVSLRGSLALGHNGGPLVRSVRKSLSRIYSKGEVLASGQVLPLRR